MELTVIIPFLNEGDFLTKTVESIRETSPTVNIILIDDCCTDGYDYISVALKHNCRLIHNKERQGVAESRNIGVRNMSTEYALILDAHMKFYSTDWVDIIINQLKKDDNGIYCTNCTALNPKFEEMPNACGGGSFLKIDTGKEYHDIIEPHWISDGIAEEDIIDIPCVLGASYSFSKTFWDKIRGLDGLIKYGVDEALLSIKTWLAGGKCRLINTVTIGHVFGRPTPFSFTWAHRVYNKMWVINTCFPEEELEKYNKFLTTLKGYKEAKEMFDRDALPKVAEYREYFKGVFNTPFKTFYDMNAKYCDKYIKLDEEK